MNEIKRIPRKVKEEIHGSHLEAEKLIQFILQHLQRPVCTQGGRNTPIDVNSLEPTYKFNYMEGLTTTWKNGTFHIGRDEA